MRHLRVLLWIPALCGMIHLCASCGADSSSERNANPQAAVPATPTVEVVSVSSKKLAITVRLPGELQPFEAVAVFPKVTGFVESIKVDRGSVVKAGQNMIRLIAPEIAAQRAEAQSKLQELMPSAPKQKPSCLLTKAPIKDLRALPPRPASLLATIWKSPRRRLMPTAHVFRVPGKARRPRNRRSNPSQKSKVTCKFGHRLTA